VIEALVIPMSLILARVAAFVGVLPVFGGTQTPNLVKLGLTMALTVMWSTSMFGETLGQMPATATTPTMTAVWILALGREAAFGALFGFLFSLFLLPARIAGEFLAQEMGLSFGAMASAVGTGSETTPATILELFASLLFLGLDLHHVFLAVLDATFRRFPVGQGLSLPMCDAVGATASAEEWGILLGMPVALCLFVATIALAFLNRAAPQLNLYTVGFPLRLIVGLGALVVMLPYMIAGIVQGLTEFADMVSRLT
jgi:flagellar biosynthetic protein FliR